MRLTVAETEEDLLLKQALEMSMQPTVADDDAMSGSQGTTTTVRDFSMMSEEEQFAYAMQMSLGESGADG
jgi:Ubiquitin interaction motif